MASRIDHEALFIATPSPYLVLGPDLVIIDVNRAYLDATGRTREDLLGRHVFSAFPDNPADPGADGVQNLNASLRRVLTSRKQDTMALQKYDIPVMGQPGAFEERWWSPVNTPVLDPDGQVLYIIHRVEDLTAFVKAHQATAPSGPPVNRHLKETEALEAELYVRARELQRLNEELRQAHTREREVAVTLQEAMLHAPDLAHHAHDVAVRYLPATGSLNVCGDWYDVVDISPDCLALAVGDVIGHGLQAAAVMGMLRSALSAAVRALERPAQALEVLGLYSRSVEGALGTTAAQTLVDSRSLLITYSIAGHPPPVLVHPGHGCLLLEGATDPPLGARPQHVPRPQASLSYRPGDTLVLYTDGLIERRGEDIDTGLRRLTDVIVECDRLDTEEFADTVLERLDVAGGGRDDIALVVARL
ncbi:SpoIIE family protein phosphatase [Streptomyces sp. NPDC101158]|uniref:SpoIIE family protein phosphatase n=1 Tax=Streptomyces sp. NPDC101158 TaxID=3366117 RepID=UPI00383051C3